MTGFGRGVSEQARLRATVDVRAVNHRFVDLKLRGAPVSPATEEAIAQRIRNAIERGAVTVAIHCARLDVAAAQIDTAAARAAHAALAELAHALGLHPPDLALVLAQPGVVVVPEDDRDPAAEAAVLTALDAALVQLAGMREVEGQALARELVARIDELSRLKDGIAELAAGMPDALRRRLHDRLQRLIRDEAADKQADAAGWLDPARLAQEVALLAERADVTEELVRLHSHLDQARALVGGKAAAGRRLDFLVQEIGRELNTIGSKSAAAEITAAVVEAKATLEKVREQVQNVE
ncbi:MAG TPA: YicC/YloC family endoribonuclease [Kofleriaceae bacterium]|nr:YicC/YloC family endoribonuclease [Kofleriaceae bacterium]